MKHRTLTLIALLTLCTATGASLHAQVQFGAQASWGDNSDFGIGARLDHGLQKLFPNTPLRAAASFDYFFPSNNVNYWEINYNVFYQLKADALTPYAGGGLVLAYASSNGNSNSDLGVNLGGGLKFKTGSSLTPFIEARVELGAGEQFVLTGGLLF